MSKTLIESGTLTVKRDGTVPVVLITPGKGSSGYYSEELIARDAPVAWPKGTHVYLDHLKEGETRTPEKLLGTLIEETTIDDRGRAINVFKPLTKHREWIEEVAPFVGLSISAQGTGETKDLGQGPVYVVESLEPHITNTVDVVSYAGRGGKFLESLYESAEAAHASTHSESSAVDNGKVTDNMATVEEQLAALTTAVAGLVAKIDAVPVAPVVEEAKPDEDRKAAIAATLAVESAEVTPSLKAALIESIEAGNYDVQAQIDADVKYREEVKAELTKSLAEAGVSAGASSDDNHDVKGW
jgi:hypothetical protein